LTTKTVFIKEIAKEYSIWNMRILLTIIKDGNMGISLYNNVNTYVSL